MASRKAGDAVLPECSCTERDMKGGKVQCVVVWRQAVWWRQASVWAGKRKDRECQRAVCIRRGAVDVVIEVLCGGTGDDPVEWSVRARGILGNNTNKHCYSLNRAILLKYVITSRAEPSLRRCFSEN